MRRPAHFFFSKIMTALGVVVSVSIFALVLYVVIRVVFHFTSDKANEYYTVLVIAGIVILIVVALLVAASSLDEFFGRFSPGAQSSTALSKETPSPGSDLITPTASSTSTQVPTTTPSPSPTPTRVPITISAKDFVTRYFAILHGKVTTNYADFTDTWQLLSPKLRARDGYGYKEYQERWLDVSDFRVVVLVVEHEDTEGALVYVVVDYKNDKSRNFQIESKMSLIPDGKGAWFIDSEYTP